MYHVILIFLQTNGLIDVVKSYIQKPSMEFQPHYSITDSKLKKISDFINNMQLEVVNSRLGTDHTSSVNKKRLSCLRTHSLHMLDFKQIFHVLEQNVDNFSAQDKMEYEMKRSKPCYTIVKNFERESQILLFCPSQQPTTNNKSKQTKEPPTQYTCK